jgi:hypothetical protein
MLVQQPKVHTDFHDGGWQVLVVHVSCSRKAGLHCRVIQYARGNCEVG